MIGHQKRNRWASVNASGWMAMRRDHGSQRQERDFLAMDCFVSKMEMC